MSFKTECFYIGLDVGSVSVKLSLIGHGKDIHILKNIQHGCNDLFEKEIISLKWQNAPLLILNSKYRRIMGEPVRAALDLLRPIIKNIVPQHHISLSVTGSGGKLISLR